MKKMSCWGFPWAKISQCEMPDPSAKTKKRTGIGKGLAQTTQPSLDASYMTPRRAYKAS